MKAMVLLLGLLFGVTALWGEPKEHGNDWRPTFTVMEPVCQATDWNQDMSTSPDGQYFCGCDPLAWGQVLTYHALSTGFPAPTWEPTVTEGEVTLSGNAVVRKTKPGPYDWLAIRDKEKGTGTEEPSSPVKRLMWDIGAISGTAYYPGGAAGTAAHRIIPEYFPYAGVGNRYGKPIVGGSEVPPYWRGMLRRLLRTSLQARAPLVTSISRHAIVTDGWGVDADGEEWFHVDYGWGSASGRWWNLDKAYETIEGVHALVHPNDLGAVISGRVATASAAPVVGARVTLRNRDGRTLRTAVTDAFGGYAFLALPRVDVAALSAPDAQPTEAYAVLVEAEGYAEGQRTVEVQGFVDDGVRQKKQDAWESEHGKDDPIFYPHAYGGAVADFVLSPVVEVLYAAPGGTGDGASWATAAPLAQATLDAAKAQGVREVRVAEGDYVFQTTLTLPEGLTMSGGWHIASGLCDPLGAPSVLRWEMGRITPTNFVSLGAGAVLEGFRLTGETAWSNSVVFGAGPTSVVRRCLLSGTPAKAAERVRLETSAVLNAAMGLEAVEVLHCTFAGVLPEDKEGQDLGGNRVRVEGRRELRPSMAVPCAAGHACPAGGLDGRPLCGNEGALAPDLFGLPTGYGYRLRLR